MACPVLVATMRVWPSGAALAVKSAASVFDAPGRFSTTNGCLKRSANLSASRREMMSMPPRRGAGHDFHRPRRVGLAERGARPEQEQDRDRAHSGLESVAGLEDPPYRSQAGREEQARHPG